MKNFTEKQKWAVERFDFIRAKFLEDIEEMIELTGGYSKIEIRYEPALSTNPIDCLYTYIKVKNNSNNDLVTND